MAKKQPTARAGKVLGRYEIERELGRGGMGVVYLARDQNLQRRVALKTTSVAGLGSGERSRNQRRKRFIREVQALAHLNHDNVVHVYDAGEQDDPDLGWLLFYSMQFVDGITLAQLVQDRGPMDPAAAAAVCMQVASGLGAAHHKSIVHRDVKPANIFLTADRRALIGDFGICKIEGSTQITRRDQLVGTPNYLAPEQILGEPVTPATDVFALAALFYVVTTNRPLRTKVDAASLLASANSNAPRDKLLKEKRIPSGLRKCVARALERDPATRYKDGDSFADALSEFATRIPSLAPDATGPVPPAPRPTDTDPFAPINRGNGGASAMSAVELAAQALLNEVGQSSTSEPKKKPPKMEKIDALPVAQTESTAMFNLKAYEENKAKEKELEALPVAKTESTVVFKLKQNEEQSSTNVALDEQTADPDDTADGAAFTVIDDNEVIERTKPAKPQRPLPPLDQARVRMLSITAAGAAGAALFVVVLLYVLMTPSAPDIPPPRLASLKAAAPKIPEHCGAPAKDERDREAAELKVQKAIRAKNLNDRQKVALLQQAIELDHHSARAHFYLAAIVAADSAARAMLHYECTAAIAPTTKEGRTAKKVLRTTQ
jgi:serine/threonine-protein kinase